MKHHNQLRSGSLLTYVQMTLNIIVSIAYTPFMLRILGKSEYGLYSTVASTIAILSVLSLGFGGSYVRYYILYRKEKADDKIARLNGLFLIVFSVIGLIALACGLYLTFHLEMVFKTGLTDAEYHTARILMLLLTANLAVSFPMSVFSNIISAQEQFVFLKATEILRTVVSPLVTLPVLLAGYGSIGMVVITVTISVLVDVLRLIYCFGKLHIRVSFRNFDGAVLKRHRCVLWLHRHQHGRRPGQQQPRQAHHHALFAAQPPRRSTPSASSCTHTSSRFQRRFRPCSHRASTSSCRITKMTRRACAPCSRSCSCASGASSF